MKVESRKYLYALIDASLILLVLLYVAEKLQWLNLFTRTTTTGGDMASHFPTAVYLKDMLLPKGRLMGWYPGNFCGFPLFQFYFPLPFLPIVLLSYVVPMQISFKLISVLGVFLLPLCAYLSMRLARQKFPTPALAAIFSLAFLFSEGNSMWGGNILSNLAGEFSFQISFGLSIVFLFSIYRNIHASQYVILNGLLLGVIGLCHGVGLIFAVLVPAFFLIRPVAGLWERLIYLLRIYGLALGFMAFWFFPFLAGSRWSTKFNFLWQFSGIKEVFPEILWPFLVIAIIGTFILSISQLYEKRIKSIPFSDVFILALYLWFAVVVAVILFETAYELNVVDIRFLPYVEFFPALIAALTIGYYARSLKGIPFLVLILSLGTGIWVHHHEKSVKSWSSWNYNGFEGKQTWAMFYRINYFLKGNQNDPRVVYEHSPLYNRFGTTRAFENLAYFSGRSTLEGLYVQSSISAPFAFYLQSEISSTSSNPLPQYDYSSPNIDKAVRHFRLLNISHFIAVSEQIKLSAKKHKDLQKVATFDDIEIFKVKPDRNEYVVPLEYHPATSPKKDWRNIAYQWFRKYSEDLPFILFSDDADSQIPYIASLKKFTTWGNFMSSEIKGETPIVKSYLAKDAIDIKTTEIGRPLLVKVSYHPNWHCKGAIGPFLVSPSLMMIIPTKTHIQMVFKKGPAEWAGLMTTFLTAILCSFKKIRPVKWLLNGDWKINWIKISSKKQVALTAVCWVIVIGCVSIFTIDKRLNSPERLKQIAMKHYSSGEIDDAITVFSKILDISPDESYGDDANYFLALSYWRKNDYKNTALSFSDLIRAYPESQFIPEALFHIQKSETMQGNKDKAREAAKQLMEQFPDNLWTQYSVKYIKENP